MKTKSFVKPTIVVASMAVLSSALGFYYLKQEDRPPILEVYIFAEKSGRSLFIRTPEDKRILVDGGANSEVIRHISEILPFYSRRIDMVIATNDLGKNVGGLIDVVKRYEVGSVYLPAFTLESLGLASSSDQIYQTLVQTVRDKMLPTDLVQQGRMLSLDSKSTLEILFPAPPESFAYSKASAPEVLFTISYGNNKILFAGNATPKTQRFIASTTASVYTSANVTGHSYPQAVDVVIVSYSALPQSFAKEFASRFHPQSLIYTKAITKATMETETKSEPASKNKKKEDPFVYLSSEHRFNIKEWGGVKIVSDGSVVTIGGI